MRFSRLCCACSPAASSVADEVRVSCRDRVGEGVRARCIPGAPSRLPLPAKLPPPPPPARFSGELSGVVSSGSSSPKPPPSTERSGHAVPDAMCDGALGQGQPVVAAAPPERRGLAVFGGNTVRTRANLCVRVCGVWHKLRAQQFSLSLCMHASHTKKAARCVGNERKSGCEGHLPKRHAPALSQLEKALCGTRQPANSSRRHCVSRAIPTEGLRRCRRVPPVRSSAKPATSPVVGASDGVRRVRDVPDLRQTVRGRAPPMRCTTRVRPRLLS